MDEEALAGLRLNVRIDEGQGPVIVMLHGINSNAEDLRPVIDHLGSGHRIIAPDLLGFGDSPKPLNISYSLDEHAVVLNATLSELGITDRFLLFGYSLGGTIAMRYAATYPEQLRRLFLLSAPFYLPPELYSKRGFGLEYAQAMFFTWMWRVIGRQKERDTPVYQLASGQLRTMAESFLRAGDISQHWDIMARTLENTISQSTFVDDLPKLDMPAVFALGIRDPIVRPDQTQALKRIKPDLDVRRILGLSAGHVLIESTPERVAAEVLRDEVDDLNCGFHAGTGAPLVVLPGLQQDWRDWRAAAADLSSDHEVLVLDLLGTGDSPAPLACHYDLDDHAAAVVSTTHRLFGDRQVTLAGRGFGATVALACAATEPGLVREVVGVAPVLPDPTGETTDPHLAALLGSRDVLLDSARDERVQRMASERLEHEVLPAVRSITAALAVDSDTLLKRVDCPVRLVLDESPGDLPHWLADESGQSSTLRVDTAAGLADPRYANQVMAAAVRGDSLPERGAGAAPVGAIRIADPMSRLLGGVNARLVRRGLFQLLLGLPLLLWPTEVSVVLVLGVMTIWLAAEGAQALFGAFALRRRGRPWLGFVGSGLLQLAFAVALLAGNAFAVDLLDWIIGGGAVLRGIVLLFVARRAPRTPGMRWLLVVDGLLSLLIGVSVAWLPLVAAVLLQWVIGGYLVFNAVSNLAVAYRNHRHAQARVREYLRASTSLERA